MKHAAATPHADHGLAHARETATLVLPPEFLEHVARRAAAIVLERLEASTPEPELLTVGEAAELLRCKPQRVYDLLSDGRLERLKDGARVLVRRADVVAHLRPTVNGTRTGRGLAR